MAAAILRRSSAIKAKEAPVSRKPLPSFPGFCLPARLLKEACQQLWEYRSPAWAGKFLDEWCRQTMRSRIEPMEKIARSLRKSSLTHPELHRK
jgi:hypothetical protein